jgi:hypothetical protein
MSDISIVIIIASSTSIVAITFVTICLVKCCRYYSNKKYLSNNPPQILYPISTIPNNTEQVTAEPITIPVNTYYAPVITKIPINHPALPSILPSAPPIDNLPINYNIYQYTPAHMSPHMPPHNTGIGGNGYYAPNFNNYTI